MDEKGETLPMMSNGKLGTRTQDASYEGQKDPERLSKTFCDAMHSSCVTGCTECRVALESSRRDLSIDTISATGRCRTMESDSCRHRFCMVLPAFCLDLPDHGTCRP